MKKLLNLVGKKTLTQMAELPRNQWLKHLKNETYVRKGKVKHYTQGTVMGKYRAMDAITIRGLLPEALLNVYKDSLHVPTETRKQAGEIYKRLRPMTVLLPMKISKLKQKKQK